MRMAGPYLHPRLAVFVACVFLLSGTLQRGSAVTNPGEVSALNGLSNQWTASPALNWGSGDPCDNQWDGVTCDPLNTTVTQLVLSERNLAGKIAPEIGGLTGLTTLDLSSNTQLTGPLPAEIGKLTNLIILSIQYCQLTGPLPTELGNLTKLQFLGLNSNTIDGPLPASLGNTNLTWLDVSTNQLSGTIPIADATNPIALDNITSIVHLHLNNNSFTGSVPAPFFSLPSIQHVLVNFNNLSGSLPNVTSPWSPSLTVIRVDGNSLVGIIPSSFTQVPGLQMLNVRGNGFSGQIPNFSKMTTLNFLDLSYNSFDQEQIPSWLSSLTNLETLNFAQMNLDGPIPSSLFDLPAIQAIDLSFNNLNGSLTFQGTSSANLSTLNLQHNNIDGFLGSPTASSITNLSIVFEQNPICQNTFVSLAGCTGDINLYPYQHSPTACGNTCDNGKDLNWYTCSCAYPLVLDLLLTAPTFSNLDSAATQLESDLASTLDLNSSQVFVAGMNYSSSATVEAVVWVFPTSGDTLPRSLSDSIVSTLRHHMVNLRAGPYLVTNYYTEGNPNGHKKLSTGAIIGIVVGAVFGVFIVAASIAYAVYHKRRADRAVMNNPFASWGGGSAEFGEAPKLKGARWFSLAELKAYTNNWSDDNMIGVGGYGRVYRGELPNGDLVAIKRATEGSMQGANEFKNEIELLSRVHHRNLVGLVGFCYEGGEQALIYEFMSNGTLTDHLTGEKPLSWERRLEIALASAIGINYLHDHATPPIIHRDIKSANILLNEKLVAKVADFGLSKLAPDEGEKAVYSVNVKGTLGYLDPEYYMTQNLTDKSDVYSFGVVLLELLTARPPIDQGRFVVREFRNALDRGGIEALRPLMDPTLQDLPTEELEPFLKIALSCVEEDGASRPTTAEIVKLLQGLDVFAKPKGGVRPMDIESGTKKVKFADEFENDQEELLSTEFPQASPETLYPSDSFKYSGAYGASMTVKPK
ncbi:unnamed protein product [Calypogeia fissa]